jgi:hypothetical protein
MFMADARLQVIGPKDEILAKVLAAASPPPAGAPLTARLVAADQAKS